MVSFSDNARFWVGVASRDHVKLGKAYGFCQMCHGKLAPVKALSKGDGLIYYSPREQMRGGSIIQAFTAIGQVTDEMAYPFLQAPGFTPMRRNICYFDSRDISIRPLIDQLSFLPNKDAWGMVFRRGILKIPRNDFMLILSHMLTDKRYNSSITESMTQLSFL